MHLIYPVLYMLGEVTKAQQEAVRKLQVISHKDEAPMVKVGVREGMMMRSIVRSDHAKGANTHAWERYGYVGSSNCDNGGDLWILWILWIQGLRAGNAKTTHLPWETLS